MSNPKTIDEAQAEIASLREIISNLIDDYDRVISTKYAGTSVYKLYLDDINYARVAVDQKR